MDTTESSTTEPIRRRVIAGWALLAVVVLLACSSTTTATPMAYVTPPVVTSAALQPTVESAQVDAYVEAVRAERQQHELAVTLDALYGMQTATSVAAQATAVQRNFDATATVEAIRTTATAQAWQATATAAAAQATATAAAESARATATAQAAQTTATIEAAIFHHAATATVAAWSVQATATAEAHQGVATVQAAEAARAAMAARREELTYPVRAYGPWVLLTLAALLLLWGGWRLIRVGEARLRVVKMAGYEREIILLDGKIVQPGRQHRPVLDYRRPDPTTSEDQRDTTARSQFVELMRASHPQPALESSGTKGATRVQVQGPERSASQYAMQRVAQRHPRIFSRVRIVSPTQVRGWLNDVRPQAHRDALIQDLYEEADDA